MTWTQLLASRDVQRHRTSKKELDDIRALVARDLADANVAALSADRRFATAYNAALLTAHMAGALDDLRQAAFARNVRIQVAPSTVYEALRTRDAALRARLLLVMTHRAWARLMPEVRDEAHEFLTEVRRLRPEWLTARGKERVGRVKGASAASAAPSRQSHSAHHTEGVTVHYPWHPLHGQTILVQRSVRHGREVWLRKSRG